MANERAKPDVNRAKAGVVAGVTDNAALEIVQLRVDPTTLRLKVEATGALTQQTEDAAHVSGDTGTMILAVRQDTPGNLSGADGDYEPLQVSGGRVWASAKVDTALPAGTNAIGKLAANSGVDIGDVDVTSLPAFATGDNTIGRVKITDGTDVALVTAGGLLQVDASGATVPVSGTFWQATQPVSGTFWQATQPVSIAATVTVDSELPAAAALADTTANPTTPLVGVALELFNGTTWDRVRGDTTNGLDVDVTRLSALVAGTAAIGKLAANSGVDIGDVDVTSVPAPLNVSGGGLEATALRVTIASDSTGLLSVDDNASSLTIDNAQLSVVGSGTEAAALRVTIATDSTGLISVDDNAGSLTVDVGTALPAGTNAIGKLAANSGVDIGDVDVTSALITGSTVAHDAADSGNPLKIGGRADTTFQAAAADGDRVDAAFDVYGVQITRNDHPNRWSYHENSSSALTDTSVQAAPGVGLSIYITDISVSTGAATALNFFLEEGATTVFGPIYLEATAGRSWAAQFKTPKKITANTAVTITTSAAILHSVDIQGFIAP